MGWETTSTRNHTRRRPRPVQKQLVCKPESMSDMKAQGRNGVAGGDVGQLRRGTTGGNVNEGAGWSRSRYGCVNVHTGAPSSD